MASENSIVAALACSVPEEDVAVHAAGGDVGAARIEAGAKDFA